MRQHNTALFLHDGNTFRVSLETVTPEIAREWLRLNVRNRKFTESQVTKVRDALVEDEWCFNGATIVFDSEGNLSDGQHRLIACVRANKPFVTLVVRGVEPMKAQDTTDNTRRRTLHTQLQMRGEKNAKDLASSIVTYWQLLNHGTVGAGVTPSITQGLRLLSEHPELRSSVRVGNRAKERPVRFPTGLSAALHYSFSLAAGEDADVFWTRLSDGHDLTVGNPIFALRERCIAEAARTNGTGMTRKYRGAITIKAWNSWIRGEEMRQLRWRSGGANPEPFPTILGHEGAGDVA